MYILYIGNGCVHTIILFDRVPTVTTDRRIFFTTRYRMYTKNNQFGLHQKLKASVTLDAEKCHQSHPLFNPNNTLHFFSTPVLGGKRKCGKRQSA